MSKIYYDKTLGKLRDENDSSGGSGGVTREYVNEAVATHNDSAEAHADLLAVKVDKESGKGLSANDYTTVEKNKLSGLSNYDDSGLRSELATKATPTEIAEAVSTHNESATAHSALFAVKADAANVESALALKADLTALSTKADLVNGRVPASQLPDVVSPIVEVPTLNDLPETGDSNTIYVTLDTNQTYRWGGSEYVEISKSLALGETPETAFAGNRGLALETALPGKVDKVTGKSLLADTEITRLAGVDNYDDTEIRGELATKATPADIAVSVSAHNSADDAHSALFAAKADLIDGVLAAAQVPPNVVQAVSAIEGVQQVGIFPCEQAVSSPLHGAVTDFNQMRTQGNYWIPHSANAANFPIRGAGHLQVFFASANYLLQIYTLYDSGELFTRSFRAGTWDPWIRYAQTSQFINPGMAGLYETINIGPARPYKTLTEAYNYMQTKNMGLNKGFDLVLDAGSYASEVSLYRTQCRIRSADPENPAVIGTDGSATFNITNSSRVIIENIRFYARLNIELQSLVTLTDVVLDIADSGNAVSCRNGSTLTMSNCQINQKGTAKTGTGLYAIVMSNISLRGCSITGFNYALTPRQGSYVYFHTAESSIVNCNIGGYALDGSNALMPLNLVSFSGVTTECTPAANTNGNYNSYIRRT